MPQLLLASVLIPAAVFIPAPGPLPSGLHTRLHLETLTSPLVSVRAGGEDGFYPDSGDRNQTPWLVGGRMLFGIDFSPRFELGMGAGYSATLQGERTLNSILLEARLSWYPIDLEYRSPTFERPRSKAGVYLGLGPTINWEPRVGDLGDSTLFGVGTEVHAAPVVSWQADRQLTTLTLALEGAFGLRRFSNGESYLRDGYVIQTSLALVIGGSLAL
ncbi:MAG: hypothetical protein H6718_28870 [Polyangiaceae bacterium]|nr:hypothetical protein [Myxococcales bacterium]MCB9589461.1 hypothetical protein [Polyangiaceae bacterium]